MKIKEVIEKTGLTDRAIRLYIDEGLAVPSIAESYSGRKSIEFSESDVERLKNIALLRKAGFSIAEIKSLVDDESAAKEIIENFIVKTEKNIAEETEILERLKNISFDEDVTLETICDSLSAAVEEKEVPREDLRISLWKKMEQNSYRTVGILGLLVTGVIYALTPLYWLHEYKYLQMTDNWLSGMLLLYSGWIIIDVLSVLLIAFNRNKSVRRNTKGRRFLSCTAVVFMMFIGFFSVSATVVVGGLFPPAYSYTTDIEDYLEFDGWVERGYGEDIRNLFPEKVPSYALRPEDAHYNDGVPFTTKYFYKFTYDLDQKFDIVAEWMLSLEDYDRVKNEALKKSNNTERRGEWICVHYPPDGVVNEWGFVSSGTYIFAYHDNSRRVRYIVSDGCGDGGRGVPYYYSLDW